MDLDRIGDLTYSRKKTRPPVRKAVPPPHPPRPPPVNGTRLQFSASFARPRSRRPENNLHFGIPIALRIARGDELSSPRIA